MKLYFGFGCLVAAVRQKRDVFIRNQQDAFAELVSLNGVSNHGCYCIEIASGERYGGSATDALDKTCLRWKQTINCMFLKGGDCEGQDLSSITYTNYENCADNTNTCEAAVCQINKDYSSLINQFEESDVKTSAVCEVSKTTNSFDSCCKTDPLSLSKRFDSSTYTCQAGVIKDKSIKKFQVSMTIPEYSCMNGVPPTVHDTQAKLDAYYENNNISGKTTVTRVACGSLIIDYVVEQTPEEQTVDFSRFTEEHAPEIAEALTDGVIGANENSQIVVEVTELEENNQNNEGTNGTDDVIGVEIEDQSGHDSLITEGPFDQVLPRDSRRNRSVLLVFS